MKNEMTLDKTGLTIPGSELAECGMAGVDLSAQMTHSLLLLMPREMTAVQTADALAGLFDAASQLVSALLDACRMPCCKNCDSDVREFGLDAVPAPIRKLLLDSSLPPFHERAGAMHIASVPVRQWTGTALLNQYEFGPASVGSTQLALRSGADL